MLSIDLTTRYRIHHWTFLMRNQGSNYEHLPFVLVDKVG